jgi:hypothetical protein
MKASLAFFSFWHYVILYVVTDISEELTPPSSGMNENRGENSSETAYKTARSKNTEKYVIGTCNTFK